MQYLTHIEEAANNWLIQIQLADLKKDKEGVSYLLDEIKDVMPLLIETFTDLNKQTK